MNEHEKQPLICYHSKCADGMTAAWVAFEALSTRGEFPQLWEFDHGDSPPLRLDMVGRDIYVVDFSWPRQVILEMYELSRTLVVLDHHKTAEAELRGLECCVFDMTKSGARLTWEYFHGRGTDAPWLVQYTEDRDLWRWALPGSRAVNAYVASVRKELEAWRDLADQDPMELVAQGAAIMQYQRTIVDQLTQYPDTVKIDGHLCLAVNAPILQSEVCERLSAGKEMGACYFQRGGQFIWSLRSRPPDGIDVSAVAKHFGGGGHPQAAGFVEVTPWSLVERL